MPKTDKRVDAYIAAAEPFARPILTHIRAIVHDTVPDVEETMKWNFPHFQYKGMLCSMASFKAHAALNFWNHKMVVGGARPSEGMGSLGKIESIKDLPSKRELVAYVKRAAELNDKGVKKAQPKRVAKKPLATPPVLKAALAKNKKAQATFDAFSPSHKREYVEWITEAKTEETRDRRVAQAVEWMAEGKSRMWKYR